MAAYGALVSLSHLLHQILHPPPLYINIINIDAPQIEFLRGKIELFIDFLESYPSRRSEEIADLEARIRDAAYSAEDIIESNVIDQIHASDLYRRVETSIPSSHKKEKVPILLSQKEISSLLCEGIETVLEMFLSIEKETELFTMRVMEDVGDLQLRTSAPATSSRSPLPGGKITMVGFDDHLNRIMSLLATDESSHQIIPIVGMGGIGKTTLASAVYNNPFIVEHFHIRAWITVSQEYNAQELLIRLLFELNESYLETQESNNDGLGLQVYKKLFGRKYLIILDDIWDIQAWEEVKRSLPHNENGSRVLVTSRISNLADDLGSCAPYRMDFLDEGNSWDLFCKTIFTEEDCPVELVKIGKYIVERCSGLPLALVLISGLLSKSERTREHWEVFAGDMTSSLNFGNVEQVMKILSLSYTHLPIYLKPCFLYLAMFPEDSFIRVSKLIKLWIAEGLIKPSQDKCLEEIGYEYLEDLVSRNVILVGEIGSRGTVWSCKLHDLVRDFCITQAEREKFVCIAIKALRAASLNRSWLCPNKMLSSFIYGISAKTSMEMKNLSNSRYVNTWTKSSILSMALCWNLQTVFLDIGDWLDLPPEIWLMTQLRHLKIHSFFLPDPPDDDQNVIDLENLQTIKVVRGFKCSEHVLRRIPNLKKLHVLYGSKQSGNFCQQNLARFKKLESLNISGANILWPTIAFPISLIKLTLVECKIPWEDLSILVGSLPNLEVLRLYDNDMRGEEWNPIEGQFSRLKFLVISDGQLRIWGAENYHFPCLECLLLLDVDLEMIPLSFSEILTLQVISMCSAKDSMWTSAREISNEREQLGYEPLLLQRIPEYNFVRGGRWPPF